MVKAGNRNGHLGFNFLRSYLPIPQVPRNAPAARLGNIDTLCPGSKSPVLSSTVLLHVEIVRNKQLVPVTENPSI